MLDYLKKAIKSKHYRPLLACAGRFHLFVESIENRYESIVNNDLIPLMIEFAIVLSDAVDPSVRQQINARYLKALFAIKRQSRRFNILYEQFQIIENAINEDSDKAIAEQNEAQLSELKYGLIEPLRCGLINWQNTAEVVTKVLQGDMTLSDNCQQSINELIQLLRRQHNRFYKLTDGIEAAITSSAVQVPSPDLLAKKLSTNIAKCQMYYTNIKPMQLANKHEKLLVRAFLSITCRELSDLLEDVVDLQESVKQYKTRIAHNNNSFYTKPAVSKQGSHKQSKKSSGVNTNAEQADENIENQNLTIHRKSLAHSI